MANTVISKPIVRTFAPPSKSPPGSRTNRAADLHKAKRIASTNPLAQRSDAPPAQCNREFSTTTQPA